MRTAIAIATALLLVAACGGEDKKAAKAAKIKTYKAQLKDLNIQLGALMETPEFKDATTASYKAQAALLGAKKRGDEAAVAEAQAAYDDAAAAAEEIMGRKKQLDQKILDIRDKIYDLGGDPNKK